MQMSPADEFKRCETRFSDTQQLLLSVCRLSNSQNRTICLKPQHTMVNTNKHTLSDLLELLQKSAVEHLTTYRQLEARDFGSVVTIVTTDFDKRGDY